MKRVCLRRKGKNWGVHIQKRNFSVFNMEHPGCVHVVTASDEMDDIGGQDFNNEMEEWMQFK